MNPINDIFKEIETLEDTKSSLSSEINDDSYSDKLYENDYELLKNILDENIKISDSHNHENNNELTIFKKIKSSFSFLTKYILTSFWIFLLLMVTTNYKAYINVANSYIKKDEVEKTSESIINSVKAANITNKKEVINDKTSKNGDNLNNSLKSFVNLKDEKPTLDIDITPYENRIIIPKIGKNIPLVDIANRVVSGQNELQEIFMKELEKWVVRYPWSVKPGEIWNTFIFWHSSNFPWIKWDYNDVFATLNNVKNWEDLIIYYNQKKYVYTIKERNIINPWNIWIFKWNRTKAQVMIMTCRPIWTTLNRLVLTWELKNEA